MPSTRVTVVGSGIAGASTAYALARSGASVTLVDAALPGTATAAGAGIIQPWSGTTTGHFYELYSAGAEFYPGFIAELAGLGFSDTGYGRSGALVVNADPARLDAVEARLGSRRAAAPGMGAVARITNREARELFPPLANGLEGIHIEGGARVDGRSLRASLLGALARLGATTRAGHARLEVDGASATAVIDGQRLPADAVVIAAGAWTNRILAPLGRHVGVEPQRGQITHLRVDADTAAWPSVHPMSPSYLVSFDDSRVVVGATRETGSGFDPRVTADGQLRVLQAALEVAPGLADATLIETRVGLRPLPDGELPVVGALADLDNVFVSSGFGAAGLTLGPYLGSLLAEAVLSSSPGALTPLAP